MRRKSNIDNFLGEVGVKVGDKHIVYDYTCKEDIVDAIIDEYHDGDISIGDMLDVTIIRGMSAQDVVDIVARVMHTIEADEITQMQDVDSDTPIIIKRWEW